MRYVCTGLGDLLGQNVEVAKALCLQAADEHVIKSTGKQLFEGFVGGSVLFETAVCGFSE